MSTATLFHHIRASIAWGKSIEKEAAIDSAKNVLALIGACALLAFIDTMHVWMIPFAIVLLIACWYGDYIRHAF